MNVRPLAACRLACALVFILAVIPLAAQSQTDRPLIALYEPSGLKADTTLAAALCTVADSVELDLACLQRFEVRRLPAVDPVKELGKVRSYCQANRIDQAIMGSGSAKSGGGYAFKLALYDRRSDSVTMVQEGSCSGALDMFDTTDTLVAALLDKLSGTHLLFGSLTVQTVPEGATVSLNGKEVGPSPLSLRGLPVGTVTVSARSPGWEDGSTMEKVQDNQITDATLTLARSVGTLQLDMPADASVTLRAAGIPERILWGPSSEQLPTGSYELEASCPGLSTVKQSLTVARNAASSFRPWTGAYLEVSPEVEGATVAVDGVRKGVAPLLVEVDPGVLHRVELSKDQYEVYQAELSVAPARKVSFQPKLTMKTGSIRVQSEPAGVSVRLDDGREMKTPCTFDSVLPGSHTLAASNQIIEWRWYKVSTSTVEVTPDEQAEVSLGIVPGTAKLEMDGVPQGALVFVEGGLWEPGRQIPAGVLNVVVALTTGQRWKGTVSVQIGATAHVTMDSLVPSVPVRIINVDGKTSDWDGLLPLWEGMADHGDRYYFVEGTSRTSPFPHQPGTRLSRVFMCRDESNIYVRMDFDDGMPGLTLSQDVNGALMREVQCNLPGGKTLLFQLGASRQWGIWAGMSIWDPATRGSSQLGTLSAYKANGQTLELAVPLSRVQQYLGKEPLDVYVDVVDAGETRWNSGYATYHRLIAFLN